MKRRYQGIFILDLKDREDDLKGVIEGLEKEIVGGGGEIVGTQKMDRRKFARGDHDIDSGYYVSIQFLMEPENLKGVQQRLRFNEHVFRQVYFREEKPKDYGRVVGAGTAAAADAEQVEVD
ncbi:MAG: 30S ribosomal protein S6 [Methylacidiphilales bacterium]|nr:30S ribosomal protein S6 [Candidatus Methylacidiphilales bacterium]MDW8350185.1 30S ribosomal protein S6 [Verrucomicrobiae bacterium]